MDVGAAAAGADRYQRLHRGFGHHQQHRLSGGEQLSGSEHLRRWRCRALCMSGSAPSPHHASTGTIPAAPPRWGAPHALRSEEHAGSLKYDGEMEGRTLLHRALATADASTAAHRWRSQHVEGDSFVAACKRPAAVASEHRLPKILILQSALYCAELVRWWQKKPMEAASSKSTFAQVLGADFAETKVADLAGLHQLLQNAGRKRNFMKT